MKQRNPQSRRRPGKEILKSKEAVKRRCVGCGQIIEKNRLIRIVRNRDGRVYLDPTGFEEGRGAYVCSEKCLETALKRKALERSFRAGIREEDRNRLKSGFPGNE